MLVIIVFYEVMENTQARCIERERKALLRFKASLVDDGNLLSSWKHSEENCCAWKRIRCDNRTDHIIVLDLGFEYFGFTDHRTYIGSGEIDSALFELHYLEYLDLSHNEVTKIPKLIGSFKRLRYLNLSGNPIYGTIPSQIQNLTRLQFFDLESNGQMTVDNLEWLSYLPSLKSLTLGNINFTKALDWLQSIKMANSLSALSINLCQFPKVDIWSLSNINSSNSLRSLESRDNDIHPKTFPWLLNVSRNLVSLTIHDERNTYTGGPHSLPKSFGNLTSLAYVDLSGNEIDQGDIQKYLGKFCNLKTLDLSSNNFSGTLHDFLESLSVCSANSLETLSLSWNQLGGFIPDMKMFISLKELYLDNNQLEGPFPKSLSQFPKLLVLKLNNNQLTGPLPDLSYMSSLRELRLAYNELNNTLPGCIGELSNLKVLDLSSNSFTGAISEVHVQKLFNLKGLALSSNHLALNFSSSWIPPFQLTVIALRSCNLGPQFPRWIKTQLNLSIIDLSDANISDTIPYWFYNLTSKLDYLNLSSNHITGTLSNFPLRNNILPTIDLSSNKIHGAIPPSLSYAFILNLSQNNFTIFGLFSCTSMTEDERIMVALDLSNNMLFGRLPDCWWKLKDLWILNLENNKLFGTIPSSMGFLNQLWTLRLRSNKFSGELPSSLMNCSGLEFFDAGENNLEGKIPTWIGEGLTDLVVLHLKANKFHDSIPSTLCNLQYIRILDVSINNLSGAIPLCLDNFTSMIEREGNPGGGGFELVGSSSLSTNSDILVLSDAFITWKGIEYLFPGKNIDLLRLIDLSSNSLTGEIPKVLTNLVQLIQLNLSMNYLRGSLPKNIGQLNKLESLDLSHNQLSGKIPQSLATMSFLNYLDLSNNHLSGKIPTSTQLQSFDSSKYAGNPQLCGLPLNIKCPEDETLKDPLDSSGDGSYDDVSGEWFDMSWFRMGILVGFSISFCGVCGNMWLNTSRRSGFFQCLNDLGDWLYVRIIVKVAILKRRFSN